MDHDSLHHQDSYADIIYNSIEHLWVAIYVTNTLLSVHAPV